MINDRLLETSVKESRFTRILLRDSPLLCDEKRGYLATRSCVYMIFDVTTKYISRIKGV